MISLILSFFICLVLSAFFSGAEMAFISSNKFKLRELADAGSRPAQTILSLHDHPHEFLTTILIGNNIVNIAATVLFTVWLDLQFGIENEWLVTAIMAPLLIIFAEMVPKDYCRLRSHAFLLKYSGWLKVLSRLFYFPTVAILKAVDSFLAPLAKATPKSIFVDEEEFRSLIDESTKSGIVTTREKKLIDTVLDFERIHVESVMIPVERVLKVDITGKIGDVKEIARKSQQKMVLVTEEIPTLIVGMIYVFDLLFEENVDQGLKNYLRSPIFLPRHTSIEKAFLTLQEKHQSFAVVTDVNGEVIGVVPIERLLVL